VVLNILCVTYFVTSISSDALLARQRYVPHIRQMMPALNLASVRLSK